jgi:hypothetical protein
MALPQEGWKPVHLLAEHDNTVTGVSCSNTSPDMLVSVSDFHLDLSFDPLHYCLGLDVKQAFDENGKSSLRRS